jgi:hypothetical protein
VAAPLPSPVPPATPAPVVAAASAPARAPATAPRPRPAPKNDLLQRVADRVFADSGRAKKQAPTGVQSMSIKHRALHPIVPLRQFLTLSLRMITVIISDRGYAIFLLGLPLALALLSRAVPGSKGLTPDPFGASLQADRLLVVFIIGAAFMGMAIAIREIINESSIYRRERAIGLSPSAYLASKLAVFIIIDIIQIIIFVNLALLGQGGPTDPLVFHGGTTEVIFAVSLVAIASTSLGLLGSALVRTSDQTTPILVVSVMAQLVLCGGLFQIAGQKTLEIISWIDPSRWGFAASAATTNLVNFPLQDPIWTHAPFNWWRAVVILFVQIVLLVAGARLALRRYEPGRA